MTLNADRLDRWITGNYGEDQYPDDPPEEIVARCECGEEIEEPHLDCDECRWEAARDDAADAARRAQIDERR